MGSDAGSIYLEVGIPTNVRRWYPSKIGERSVEMISAKKGWMIVLLYVIYTPPPNMIKAARL